LKLKDIYNSAVLEGIKRDLRGKKLVEKFLAKTRKEYNALSANEKKFFDGEKFTNPYSDTRILFGNPQKEVKNILVGIDMEAQEILLAEALKKRGKRIDLIMSHHPEGFALSALHGVMSIQLDILESVGVPRKKAKKLLDVKIEEVVRKIHPANIMRPVDTARLLGFPFMCTHTVADNCVSAYLNGLICKNKPRTVNDLIGLIGKEPEYEYAISTGSGPRMIWGKPTNACGKVIVEMTGGTGGPKKIFPELIKAGVKTIVAMHMSEENFKKAKKHKLNILIAGHIASDSLGMNLLLSAIDPKGKLNIIPCSGFIRVKR
jgi:hypothetical protein